MFAQQVYQDRLGYATVTKMPQILVDEHRYFISHSQKSMGVQSKVQIVCICDSAFSTRGPSLSHGKEGCTVSHKWLRLEATHITSIHSSVVKTSETTLPVCKGAVLECTWMFGEQ